MEKNDDNVRAGGVVCGQNCMTGKIENCIASGKIIYKTFGSTSMGGITAYSSGKIMNCRNETIINLIENVEGEENNSGEISIGGICSSTGSTGEVKNCYNIGAIMATNNKIDTIHIGGIIGSGYGKITNCYNIGDIKGGSKNILNIGGIDGNGKDNIKSCYNIGNIEIVGGQDIRKGMIIGKNRSDISKITNVYYKETEGMTAIGNGNIGDNSTMVLTEDKMKNNEEFVNLLNQDENAWKMDTNNINEGYPILSWQ